MSELALTGSSGYFNPDFFNGQAPELPPIDLREKVRVEEHPSNGGVATVEEILNDFSMRYPDDELFFIDSNRLNTGLEILGRQIINLLESGQGKLYLSTPERGDLSSRQVHSNSGWYILDLIMPTLERYGAISDDVVRIIPHETKWTDGTYTIPETKNPVPVIVLDDWISLGIQMNSELSRYPSGHPVTYLTIAGRLVGRDFLDDRNFKGTSLMYANEKAILTGSHCSMDATGGLYWPKSKCSHPPLIKLIKKPYLMRGYRPGFSFNEKGKITINS
jgi:hypothetical protein